MFNNLREVADYLLSNGPNTDLAKEILNQLPGSYEDNLDLILEIKDVEEYTMELEAPPYDGQLLDWLGEAQTSQRLAMANEALMEGATTVQQAISMAWIQWKSELLLDLHAVLENYIGE